MINGRRLFGPSADTQAEALRRFDANLAKIRAQAKPKPDDSLSVSEYFYHLLESGVLRAELAPALTAEDEAQLSVRPSLDGLSRRVALKMLGNAVVPAQVLPILQEIAAYENTRLPSETTPLTT